MKNCTVLLISTLLVSCTAGSEGSGREEYWQNEVNFLNSQKIALTEVQERYAKYAPILDETKRELVIVETEESLSLVCSRWHYIINIDIDETSVVKGATLSKTGTCL